MSPLRRKKPMARGKGLSRGRKPLRSRGRVNPVNRARKDKRWPLYFGSKERVQWVNSLPCACAGQHPKCRGPIQNGHTRSRAAGGTWRDIIPMSEGCHTEQHAHGWGCWHRDAKLELGYAKAYAAQLAEQCGADGVPRFGAAWL